MDKLLHPTYFKIIISIIFFLSPSKGENFDTIDLSKLDVYFHEGFSLDWTQLNPQDASSWKRISGQADGRRSLSIRNLELPNQPKQPFLSLWPTAPESFTFVFLIPMDSSQAFCDEGIGLGLVGIAYNWQIYFNGHLIDDQFFGIKNGHLIQPKRQKRYFKAIPNHFLKEGINQLTIHIVGSRDFNGTGLYYSQPYLITSLADFNKQPLQYSQYGLVWFYSVVGLFWLFMFVKLPKQYNYLYFTGWSFAIAGYNLARIDFLTPLKNLGLFTFRFEYVCIFLSSLFFIGFVQELIHQRLTKPAKILMGYFGLSAILSVWAPVSFINDLLRVWQVTLPIPMGMIIFELIRAFRNKFKGQNKKPFQLKYFYNTTLGSLPFGTIILFSFLGFDIISSTFYFNFDHLNLIGFLIFTATITFIAFSEFIQHHLDTQIKKNELEADVISHTKAIRALSKELIRAQENERARLSRELHDEVGQALTVINLGLQHMAQNKELKSSEKILAQIRSCQNIVEEAADTIQRFAFDLRPSILDDLGLVPAIKAHTDLFAKRTQIEINIHAEPIEIDNDEIRITLYRIIQESLTNTAKHSNAEKIEIFLKTNESVIELTIQDNGGGFQPSSKIPSEKSGLGLVGMQERIEGVGGSFHIQPTPGEGVQITALIPLKEVSSS